MTPVQVAAEIKRLDKEIAKADEGIHASRAKYEPDLSARRAGWHRLLVKSEQDMTRPKANSCENAYYAMTSPLMVKMSGSIQQRPLHSGCQRVLRSSNKLRRSCLFAVKAKIEAARALRGIRPRVAKAERN
jgi:hypothetical protein